jgi:hypothetical protein
MLFHRRPLTAWRKTQLLELLICYLLSAILTGATMGVPESLSAVKRDRPGLPNIWRKNVATDRCLILCRSRSELMCRTGRYLR